MTDALAIEVAAQELIRSALSSATLEVSSRGVSIARDGVRTKLIQWCRIGGMNDSEISTLVRRSCEDALPLVQRVAATLTEVVDPKLEDLWRACTEALQQRVADAVRALRSSQAGAMSPANHAKHILELIDAAHAEAVSKLTDTMVVQVKLDRPSYSGARWLTMPHLSTDLVARTCGLAMQLRCGKVYTTEQALTERLALASVTLSAMAEAVGQRVAAEEASARLRLARDASELRSALSAARHLHVPAVVTELAEMRLQEMRSQEMRSQEMRLQEMQADALPRHVVAQMSDEERLKAAIAASSRLEMAASSASSRLEMAASSRLEIAASSRLEIAARMLPAHVPAREENTSDEERLALAVATSMREIGMDEAAIAERMREMGIKDPGSPRAPPLPLPARSPAALGHASSASAAAAPLAARRGAHDGTAVQLRADEIACATDNFDAARVLGKGGFGTVFAVDEGRLATLGHRGRVAVKVMDREDSQQGVHQLQNEIDILALCRHEHLLPLLGFCLDEQASCLVYPLMAGGTLEDALAPGSSTPLLWKPRVRILSAACRALLFLHTPSGAKGVILHRDVKPANILLDQHLNAKLSDVGLALHKPSAMHKDRVSHLSDELTGTIGFLDPIYSRAARHSKRARACAAVASFCPPLVSVRLADDSGTFRLSPCAAVTTGMYTTQADAYAMGITMLVCLTGKEAVHAMRTCHEMLETPSRAFEYADARAEWPNHATSTRLAQVIQGIVCGERPTQRTPFDQTVAEIEEIAELADELRLTEERRSAASVAAAAAAAAAVGPRVAKECRICMAAPRGVRFACGHLVCCEACVDDLLATEYQRVPQNRCPTCRSRIVVLQRGWPTLAFEATYVPPDAPPPPPLEPPRYRLEDSALFCPGERRGIVFRDPGLTGLHIGIVRQLPGRTVISGVTLGSPADELGVFPGSELIAINGQPVYGLARWSILDMCIGRPLAMTIVLPASASLGSALASASTQSPSRSASTPGGDATSTRVGGQPVLELPIMPVVTRSPASLWRRAVVQLKALSPPFRWSSK